MTSSRGPDPSTHYVDYVDNEGSQTLSLITSDALEVASGAEVATIPVGSKPNGMAVRGT